MLTRGLPLLLLLLIPPAIGQTSEQNPDAKDSSMLGSFLDAGMPEEVLFAVRKPSIDGHWYANIAYYSPPGWDDFEPTYLPDDRIIFCSTRANRYVQCWMTQVGTLHKCNADGSNLHVLSANVEQDNTPWVLSNGQVAYMPEIFDFQRDIQPILDQHCLECHNHDREEGGFNISGHWGPLYPIGYIQMSWRQLFGDSRIILPYSEHSKSNFGPYEIGTGSSRLLKLIEEGHEGVNMPESQQKIVRHWLDAGANHAGTYAVNSHGTIGYYLHSVNVRNDKDWPETQAMVEVMNRRCDRCHAPTEAEKQIGTYKLPAHFYARYYPPDEFQKNRYLAHTMSEDGGRFNRHLIYNLSYPELSKAARAPLAKEAGGLGVCEAKSGESVFRDKSDPDYQAIVAAVARGRRHILEENNRFCMINPSPNNGENCPIQYVPRRDYVREMIRYGVLPADHDFEASVDPFELDKAYWRTFWYEPK